MGNVEIRKSAAILAVSSLIMVTAGCSMLEDTATSAATQLTDAAATEMVRQACAPVQDGSIDAGELRVLSSIIGSVEGGGLPQPIVEVLKELASSGDQAPQALQDRLVQACDDANANNN
ncbi:hypothetical protein [Glutamicibacter sp. AOP33-2CA-4]|uniref:hypothetical protein n=1 Tax=Glutamicibacter sp. AOP33-2CA-4 TaxID=3457690 RepID=UPI0040335074